MSIYDDANCAELDEQRFTLAEEIGYAKATPETTVSIELPSCAALNLLLSELAEIAMHAPGGHQYLIEEAHRWAATFGTQADLA